jgi:DNA repair exonuclease SbcCD ATPase subunit
MSLKLVSKLFSLRTDTEQRVGETQMAHAEMGDKYRSQLGLITDLEHRLESKGTRISLPPPRALHTFIMCAVSEMELQQARAAAQAAQEQCRQAVAHAEELTAELGRVREGSQVELLEDRLHSMQSELDQKSTIDFFSVSIIIPIEAHFFFFDCSAFDLQELQKQHSSVSTMYDELSRQHEAIKRTVRTQIDRATSGTQADLADMQTKYSEAQTALKEAQSVARKSERTLGDSRLFYFQLNHSSFVFQFDWRRHKKRISLFSRSSRSTSKDWVFVMLWTSCVDSRSMCPSATIPSRSCTTKSASKIVTSTVTSF